MPLRLHMVCGHTLTKILPLPNEPDHCPAATVVISFLTLFSTREGCGFRATAMRKSNSRAGMGKDTAGRGKCGKARRQVSSTLGWLNTLLQESQCEASLEIDNTILNRHTCCLWHCCIPSRTCHPDSRHAGVVSSGASQEGCQL